MEVGRLWADKTRLYTRDREFDDSVYSHAFCNMGKVHIYGNLAEGHFCLFAVVKLQHMQCIQSKWAKLCTYYGPVIESFSHE